VNERRAAGKKLPDGHAYLDRLARCPREPSSRPFADRDDAIRYVKGPT
jgi:hypothetical protein